MTGCGESPSVDLAFRCFEPICMKYAAHNVNSTQMVCYAFSISYHIYIYIYTHTYAYLKESSHQYLQQPALRITSIHHVIRFAEAKEEPWPKG